MWESSDARGILRWNRGNRFHCAPRSSLFSLSLSALLTRLFIAIYTFDTISLSENNVTFPPKKINSGKCYFWLEADCSQMKSQISFVAYSWKKEKEEWRTVFFIRIIELHGWPSVWHRAIRFLPMELRFRNIGTCQPAVRNCSIIWDKWKATSHECAARDFDMSRFWSSASYTLPVFLTAFAPLPVAPPGFSFRRAREIPCRKPVDAVLTRPSVEFVGRVTLLKICPSAGWMAGCAYKFHEWHGQTRRRNYVHARLKFSDRIDENGSPVKFLFFKNYHFDNFW